jgi:hypothetical protein
MKIQLKFVTWLCLLCYASISLQAQEVITSSGGYGVSTSAKVSWTIGEPVTETVVGTNNILTQGFNQGHLIITVITKPDFPGLSMNAYPNPVADHLKITVKGIDYEDLRYILYDLNGNAISENRLVGIETEISVGNLAPSTYLVKIFQNKTELAIFKIIKK